MPAPERIELQITGTGPLRGSLITVLVEYDDGYLATATSTMLRGLRAWGTTLEIAHHTVQWERLEDSKDLPRETRDVMRRAVWAGLAAIGAL